MALPDRSKPVLRRTVAFLHDFVRARQLRPGDRLPALPKLAVEADVSYVTMVRAMQHLRKSGVVTLVNKHAYVLGRPLTKKDSEPRAAARPGASRPRETRRAPVPWERAAHRMRHDIVDRVFRPGAAIPSVKELRGRYRLSFRTVKKTLTQLVREGTLEATLNGGFAVPSLSPGSWRPRIVCVNMSPDSYAMSFGQNDEAVYRALELLCEQAGIAIEVLLLRNDQEHERFFLRHKATGAVMGIDDVREGDDVLGFLYMIQQVPCEFDVPALQTLFLRKRPIAVLDETARLELPAALAASRLVRVFTAAVSGEPGAVVGRHLLSLGHRRVAFVSMDHDAAWSRLRLDGLRSAFGAAGVDDGVVACVKDAGQPGRMVEQAMERCRFGVLQRRYGTWRGSIPGDYRGEFDAAMERLRWETCGRAEMLSRLKLLLDEALADRTITAWVMANDTIASMAVPYVKSRGIRIPADLSIISFDDAPEALRNGYSSFNFNAAAVADALVGFMLGRKPYCDPHFRVSGFIVNRGTTGPATGIRGG